MDSNVQCTTCMDEFTTGEIHRFTSFHNNINMTLYKYKKLFWNLESHTSLFRLFIPTPRKNVYIKERMCIKSFVPSWLIMRERMTHITTILIAVGDQVAQLNCGHIFHVPCIVPWLESHVTCPVCRAPIDLSHQLFRDVDELDWAPIDLSCQLSGMSMNSTEHSSAYPANFSEF